MSHQINLLGCKKDQAMGMENGRISDEQISASTEFSQHFSAKRGRLHIEASGDEKGAWAAATSDSNQWLQVDLGGNVSIVTGVATQGRQDAPQWVEKYKLKYSDDAANFQPYIEQGQTTTKVKYTQRITP